MTAGPISLRPLTPGDAATYRGLRQYILAIGDGRFFADSYTREAALTESQWLEWCTERREHCIIGTFDGRAMIGVMMVTQHHDDITAEWEAIWLHPRYRRQGIAQRGYRRIEQWTRSHGYERAAVYIRADNLRSQHIHSQNGACYQFTCRNVIWADNSVADARCFLIDLHAGSGIETPALRVA
jgi:GNAT superfamily N-acetyltransferase